MKKINDKLQIIISCILILTLSLAFVVLPDRELSDKENRKLQLLPRFSLGSLTSGKLTSDIADYFADQFPLRDTFVAVKAYSELILGKKENNGIIKAGDTLVAKPDLGDIRLKENLNIISEFEKATGAKTVIAAIPRSIDVFGNILPATYPKEQNKAIWDEYYSYAKGLGLTCPELYSGLTESREYYRTDHHYTTHGAYLTYELLGESLGYIPAKKDSFNIEAVTESFCGTSMRSSGYYLTKKDKIELYRYSGDDGYTVTADGKSIGLYDFSKLDTTDAYAVFLGGNHTRVDIKDGTDREKLLIIRDSFADSIVPFLALHYDITLIDLRYFNDSVRSLVAKEDFETVLILESITELSTNKNISYLKIPYKE